jgi:hypothetical protein
LDYLQRMFCVFLGLGLLGGVIAYAVLSPLVFVFIEIWTLFIDCKQKIKEICAECAAPNNDKN